MISVLYVADEPGLLKIGKIFLEHPGNFAVTTASGVYEVIDMLKEKTFDVIISDYQMPKMDGIAFLKHLKAEGDMTPFILFTGRGREDVVIEALNNGEYFKCTKITTIKIANPGKGISPITLVIASLPEKTDLHEIAGIFGIYGSPVEFFQRSRIKKLTSHITVFVKKIVYLSQKIGHIFERDSLDHRIKIRKIIPGNHPRLYVRSLTNSTD